MTPQHDNPPQPPEPDYPALGPGIPDLCSADGRYTVLTFTECTDATPTIAEACQVAAWRPHLDCTGQPPIPVRTVARPAQPRALPETGAASAPLAGGALLAVAAGLTLVRVSRRRVA